MTALLSRTAFGLLSAALLAVAALPVRSENAVRPSLEQSVSPYLRRHARHPIAWRTLSPATLDEARKAEKPLLVIVGYSSCHWCEVLERETLSDPEIAKLVNERFIPVLVDREERPDVDDALMTALLSLTGRGSWPITAFLTPDGKPFDLSAYQPRAEFLQGLKAVQAGWADPATRRDMERQGDRVVKAVETAALCPIPGKATPRLLSDSLAALRKSADEVHGGFGETPKFPMPLRLELLWMEHARKPDRRLLQHLNLTLERMARGGLYDPVAGGFHRYTADRQWKQPHFEKMLADQALMSIVYLQGYAQTRNEAHARIARETLDFCLREMRAPAPAGGRPGGFFTSVAPSSPGARQEGDVYRWTPEQVQAVLGAEEGKKFCAYFGIGADADEHVLHTLNRSEAELARDLKIPALDVRKTVDGWLAKLRVARAQRPQPLRDEKILASANGLMLRALALAARILGDERYRTAAEETAAFLTREMRPLGAVTSARLIHARLGDTRGEAAFLEDYAAVTLGLLELYQATRQESWLGSARSHMEALDRLFWEERLATWYTTPREEPAFLARVSRAEDPDVPCGQSLAAAALVRLSQLAPQDTALSARAELVLNTYARAMEDNPGSLAGMLQALHLRTTTASAAPAQ